jgi:putative oxidoreductase
MKNIMRTICKTDSNDGIALTRMVIGVVFMMHGSQKLFGLFGGGGIEGTAGYLASLGMEPSYLMALLAGGGEFFGGLLLLLGLFARLGAFTTACVSLVALFTVHVNNGFFMSNNGFEYILVLLITSISILLVGAGNYSLDRKLFCQNVEKIDLKKCCK